MLMTVHFVTVYRRSFAPFLINSGCIIAPCFFGVKGFAEKSRRVTRMYGGIS